MYVYILYVYMYVCMYIYYMYICMYVCMYIICIYVCVYVCAGMAVQSHSTRMCLRLRRRRWNGSTPSDMPSCNSVSADNSKKNLPFFVHLLAHLNVAT